MSDAPHNAWPASALEVELRSLNRNFMAGSSDNFLRGKDHWPNRQPERFVEELADAQRHGVVPVSPGEPGFEALMRGTTRFNWAILLDGTIRASPSIVMTSDGPVRISHAILSTDGQAVLAAGEGKAGSFLSSTTGHYKNEPFVVAPVKKAFEAIGIYFKR
jgi:hypothetical protein